MKRLIYSRNARLPRVLYLALLGCSLLCQVLAAQTVPADTSRLHIWHPSRTYTYRAVLLERNGDTITDDTVRIHPTGMVWDRDPQQTLADVEIDFSPEDSARLAPFPPNGRTELGWSRRYWEGVIENEDRVWMHPLRNNQYQRTELAPFPEVKLPLEAERTWSSQLYILEGFGNMKGTVDCRYAIMGSETRSYAFGSTKVWEVIATGTHNHLGVNKATYFFSEEYGFTEMNYKFHNGQRLEMVLVKLDRR